MQLISELSVLIAGDRGKRECRESNSSLRAQPQSRNSLSQALPCPQPRPKIPAACTTPFACLPQLGKLAYGFRAFRTFEVMILESIALVGQAHEYIFFRCHRLIAFLVCHHNSPRHLGCSS